MDTINQELERLRQTLAQDGGGRKFFKRSEMEQKRLQRLREEEKREAEAKAQRRQQQPENYSSKSNGVTKPDASSSSPNNLPRQEVIRRLKFLKQPVTLFGEDDEARLVRLTLLMKTGMFEVDDICDMTEGQTNDFLRDITELKKKKRGMMLSSERKRKAKDEDKIGGRGGDDKEEDYLKRMKSANYDDLFDEDKILVFFNSLLNEWNQELDGNKENQTVATFKQCARDLDPLFQRCRKKLVADDIKRALVMIVECCRKREYLAAGVQYDKIAIGNAAWPIGVTMVGIHERSAREKIHTNSVAHTMNDEPTRKYLHSVKRLMTFCQRRYPAMPSKCLEFNSLANGSDLHSLHIAQLDTGNLIRDGIMAAA